MSFNWWTENITFQGTYKTKIGQRWDQISQEVYGQPGFGHVLLWANSGILTDAQKRSSVFESEITLQIPLIDQATLYQDELPPWRRG